MISPIRLQTAVLSMLLLATMSGCAIYDERPPTVGSTYVDPRMQDQVIAQDRLARAAKAKEWNDTERHEQRDRFQRYFD